MTYWNLQGSLYQSAGNTIVINEKINLTKNQYEVLNTICKSYEKSVSKYMPGALAKSMQSDIEDGGYVMCY